MRLSCTVETAAEVAAQVRRTIAETVDVAPILEAVRDRGDEALREYEARFGNDRPGLVPPEELRALERSTPRFAPGSSGRLRTCARSRRRASTPRPR